MKFVSKGNTISSPEFYKKKQKARNKRLWIVFGILLVISAILVFIARRSELRITNISVTGADAIGSDSVANAAKEALSGHYLLLIPKDNALIYPEDKLKSELFKKFPRFSSIGLARNGFESLQINVVEREPYALYCGSAGAPEAGTCYFLDETGFIFGGAPVFSEGVYFVYGKSDALEDPMGKEFLPPEEFRAVGKFIDSLESLGIEAKKLALNGGEFVLELSRGGRIIWNRADDTDIVGANLESFLMSDEIRKQEDFIEKVAELDLRTEDKVFYRFK